MRADKWRRKRTAYRGELERLRAESDRNHALLLSNADHIAWPAGSDRADIAGDVSLLRRPARRKAPAGVRQEMYRAWQFQRCQAASIQRQECCDVKNMIWLTDASPPTRLSFHAPTHDNSLTPSACG